MRFSFKKTNKLLLVPAIQYTQATILDTRLNIVYDYFLHDTKIYIDLT